MVTANWNVQNAKVKRAKNKEIRHVNAITVLLFVLHAAETEPLNKGGYTIDDNNSI